MSLLESIGFIGSGMMASALMDAIISKKVLPNPSCIICSDVYPPTLQRAADKGYKTSSYNGEVVKKAKTALILAVKPNVIEAVCKDISKIESDAVIISIAAGVTLSTLEGLLPGRRVVRVMPNTPCLIGEAASGFSLGNFANISDSEVVKIIFGSVGLAIEVSEKHLDAVTGLSGSGPAYAFQFIEALSDGGVRCGLPRDIATKLAAQTLKGAAEMVLSTGKHPGLLKDSVTSPGGTTIAGVEALERGAFRATTISAVKAATKRSMQLGGKHTIDIQQNYDL